MKQLLDHVHKRLGEGKKSCTVFESELKTYFPPDRACVEKRKKAIEKFAQSHGFKVTIVDPGLRVTFRKSPDVK